MSKSVSGPADFANAAMPCEHADFADAVMPSEQATLSEAVMLCEHAELADVMACENADFDAVLPSENANFPYAVMPCEQAAFVNIIPLSEQADVAGIDTSNGHETNTVRSPEHANLTNEEIIFPMQTPTDEKTTSEPPQVDNSNPSPQALLLNEASTQTDVFEKDDLSRGPSPSSAYYVSDK